MTIVMVVDNLHDGGALPWPYLCATSMMVSRNHRDGVGRPCDGRAPPSPDSAQPSRRSWGTIMMVADGVVELVGRDAVALQDVSNAPEHLRVVQGVCVAHGYSPPSAQAPGGPSAAAIASSSSRSAQQSAPTARIAYASPRAARKCLGSREFPSRRERRHDGRRQRSALATLARIGLDGFTILGGDLQRTPRWSARGGYRPR